MRHSLSLLPLEEVSMMVYGVEVASELTDNPQLVWRSNSSKLHLDSQRNVCVGLCCDFVVDLSNVSL